MKTSRHIFMLSAVVLALAACTQNDLADGNNLPEGEYPLVIETTGVKDVASRATVNGNWEGVTDVALQVGAEVKTYTVSASGANKENAMLSSTAPFYWTSRENITVTAWWPYNAADLSMPEVKVKADQSSLENFKSSDYIYAHSDAVEFERPTLEFTHRTARITVALVCGTGVTSLDGAAVSLNGFNTIHENPASVTPYKVSDGFTYDALVAPQTIAQGTTFITVTLNGTTYSYVPDAAIELAAGSRYNYTVKVNAKGLELEGCTITDWTTKVNETIDAEITN
ncbi:fimbrillin family protein [Phocaeicola plebeius]|uniref:fimbrillin family protein n=1 Tax=Phocaeicola plebeius TaxID=310297 RepID=UPI00307F5375